MKEVKEALGILKAVRHGLLEDGQNMAEKRELDQDDIIAVVVLLMASVARMTLAIKKLEVNGVGL